MYLIHPTAFFFIASICILHFLAETIFGACDFFLLFNSPLLPCGFTVFKEKLIVPVSFGIAEVKKPLLWLLLVTLSVNISFFTICTLYSCNTSSEMLVVTPSNFTTYRIFIKCTLWYKGRQVESLRPNLRHYCIWVFPGNSWTAQASQKVFCNQRRLAIFPFFFLPLEHGLKTVYSRISKILILYTYI